MSIGYLILAVGLLLGAFAAYVLAGILRDRAEDRAAAFEFRHAAPARTFRVALPYQAGGSYRAAPRRTGPLTPSLDLPGPVIVGNPVTPGSRAGESHVAAPGSGTGSERDRPETRQPTPASPATISLPGRVTPLETPARPGTTYDQLYAMATAINDAWLDRLFARAA